MSQTIGLQEVGNDDNSLTPALSTTTVANSSRQNTENSFNVSESNNSVLNFTNSAINYSFLTEGTDIFDQLGPYFDTPPAVGSLIWHQEKRRAHAQRPVTANSTTNSLESYSISCSSKSSVYEDGQVEKASTSVNATHKKDCGITVKVNENFSCNSGPSTSREHYCIHHQHSQIKSLQYPVSPTPLVDSSRAETSGVSQTQQHFYYSTTQAISNATSFNNNNSVLSNNNNTVRNNVSGSINSGSTFCFGLLMVRSTFITFFIFDIILLSHSLVFTVTNYLNGVQRYENVKNNAAENLVLNKAAAEGLTIATSLIPYNFLLPLFALQILWLASAIATLIALKCVQPLFQIPYIFISALIIPGTLCIIVRCVARFLFDAKSVEWVLALILSFANLVLLAQLYFLYVKLVCVHMLFRKRKTVVSAITTSDVVVANNNNNTSATSASTIIALTKKKQDNCSAMFQDQKLGTEITKQQIDDCCMCSGCCCCDETYSTKSTIIITDEDEVYSYKKC